MKKVLSALLIVILILGSLSLTACDSSNMRFLSIKYINTYKREETAALRERLSHLSEFEYRDEALVCILKDGASGDIEIPSEHDGHPVVYLTAEEKSDNKITSLTVPDSVQYMEHVCSYQKDNDTLASVTLPDNIVIEDCFKRCAALETVELSEKTKELSDSFMSCTALESVTLGFRAKEISRCFNKCTALESIDLTGHFNKLTDSFSYCDDLKSFTLDKQLEEINNCFNSCEGLESVEFLKAPKLISDSFSRNDSLKRVVFDVRPDEIKHSFNDNPALSEVKTNYVFESFESSFENCAVTVPVGKQQTTEMTQELFDYAFQSLKNKGILSTPDVHNRLCEDHALPFDEDGELEFSDKNAEKELLAKPSQKLDGVIVTNEENKTVNLKDTESTVKSFTDCRYLIHYEAFPDFRSKRAAYTGSGFASGFETNTLIFVVDKETKQIIHIHSAGVNMPKMPYYYQGDVFGAVLEEEAQEYIRTLLK